MNAFQIGGLLVAAAALAIALLAATRHRISWKAAGGWALLWTAAAIAIAIPELTGKTATMLGIGRGADFVFYCAILAMIGGFFLMYVRYRKLEQEITILVREIALLRANGDRREKPPVEGEPASGPRLPGR